MALLANAKNDEKDFAKRLSIELRSLLLSEDIVYRRRDTADN